MILHINLNIMGKLLNNMLAEKINLDLYMK